MKKSKYLAIGAMVISAAALLPEFNQIKKTKDVKSYSKKAILLSLLGGFLWITYHVIEGRHLDTIAAAGYIIMDIYIFSLL